MTEYHEPVEELTEESRNVHRALRSLIEELEAIDWYHQRVVTSQDAALSAIMAHNRDEEMEHASMALEWLRRNMPGWDAKLRMYLFSEGDVTTIEERAAQGGASAPTPDEPAGQAGDPGDLGLGNLREGS